MMEAFLTALITIGVIVLGSLLVKRWTQGKEPRRCEDCSIFNCCAGQVYGDGPDCINYKRKWWKFWRPA